MEGSILRTSRSCIDARSNVVTAADEYLQKKKKRRTINRPKTDERRLKTREDFDPEGDPRNLSSAIFVDFQFETSLALTDVFRFYARSANLGWKMDKVRLRPDVEMEDRSDSVGPECIQLRPAS